MSPFISRRRSPGARVAALSLVLLAAVAPGAVFGQEIGILDSPVRWGRGLPLFPANTAPYYHGRYVLDGLRIDLYLAGNMQAGGLPPGPATSGERWRADRSCAAGRIFRYVGNAGGNDVEAPRDAGEILVFEVEPSPDSGDYRLFLRVAGLNDSRSLCSFIDPFMEQFRFFLTLHGERGRRLTFFPEDLPELPAVIELSQ